MNSEHGHACAARGEDSAHTQDDADPSFQRSARPETSKLSSAGIVERDGLWYSFKQGRFQCAPEGTTQANNSGNVRWVDHVEKGRLAV